MKKILIFFFVALTYNVTAQNLSLSELINLQGSKISDINDFLLFRSWTLINSHYSEDIEQEYINESQWIIGLGEWHFLKNNNILCKLNYVDKINFEGSIFNKSEEVKMVSYTFSNYEFYKIIKVDLPKLGFIKTKEIFDKNAIQISYQNNSHIVRISNITNADMQTIYYLHVLNALKYERE